ncbi:hypothetical protein JB92DRAFT_2825771 [Gautieria morchelliformis]|nr:hypothetical protein JB92DRAFT_2825771 [Gautieria morchelliformis]
MAVSGLPRCPARRACTHEDTQVHRRSVQYRQASTSRACHNSYSTSKPSERAALTVDTPPDEQGGLSEQTDFPSALRAPSDYENEDAHQPRIIPVQRSMIHALADHFSLTTPQRDDFHAFFFMSRTGPRGPANSGLLFQVQAEQMRQNAHITALTALTDDLQARLEVSFMLNKEQAVCVHPDAPACPLTRLIFQANIRLLAQDLIYDSHRTAYVTLFLDVEAVVRKEWKRLALTNVYGNPSRERYVTSTIKHICSSVRNGWRADIRDSCLGAKTDCLAQFTSDSATKYKMGGPGEHMSPLYGVHDALLRRFTCESPVLVDRVEVEAEDEDKTLQPQGTRTPKKRKKSGVARFKKGEDYWTCVDTWFSTLIEAWGADMGVGQWKQYIDETL